MIWWVLAGIFGWLGVGLVTCAAGVQLFPVAYCRGWNGPMLGLTLIGWPVALVAWFIIGAGNALSFVLRQGPRPDPYQPALEAKHD